ncbi:sulfite exporter TauE/SafE family protein [Patescibacteria group bacterium]|nr:sulfite exporter TauE/SafE family protein [Patescibacteria group bacterium]
MPTDYTFHISGMHCAACTLLVKQAAEEVLSGQGQAEVSLSRQVLKLRTDVSIDEAVIQEKINQVIRQHGYSLSDKPVKPMADYSEFKWAIPLSLLVIILFIVLQKLGIVNLINSSKVTYGTALTIGLVASLSTCLAVVGGLVLSLSANYAKQGGGRAVHYWFHVGRLVGFFILGGLIGWLGQSFNLGIKGNLILALVINIVMLLLGFNLLNVFTFTRQWQLRLPVSLGGHLNKIKAERWTLAALLGALTFFLPCGFTQAMQFYTLSVKDFWQGGLTMLFFALGTLPVLWLLSFSSFNLQAKSWRGYFFKTAGLVIIVLAVFNLLNALAGAGLIAPLFNL